MGAPFCECNVRQIASCDRLGREPYPLLSWGRGRSWHLTTPPACTFARAADRKLLLQVVRAAASLRRSDDADWEMWRLDVRPPPDLEKRKDPRRIVRRGPVRILR